MAAGWRLPAKRTPLSSGGPDTGKEVVRLTHDGSIQAINFSPDGTLLATCAGQSARLWLPAARKSPE